jgi:hypothetical protein
MRRLPPRLGYTFFSVAAGSATDVARLMTGGMSAVKDLVSTPARSSRGRPLWGCLITDLLGPIITKKSRQGLCPPLRNFDSWRFEVMGNLYELATCGVPRPCACSPRMLLLR